MNELKIYIRECMHIRLGYSFLKYYIFAKYFAGETEQNDKYYKTASLIHNFFNLLSKQISVLKNCTVVSNIREYGDMSTK